MNPMVWRKSPIAISTGVAAVVAFGVLFHKSAVHLGLTDTVVIESKVEAFLTLAGLAAAGIGAAAAFIQRFYSKLSPLTWTKAQAEARITPASQATQDLHDAIQASADKTVLPPGVVIELPVPKTEK